MKRESEEKGSFIHWLIPSKLTIALFVFYLVVITVFLYLLDSKTGVGFGIKEIAFALAAAFLLTALVIWILAVMRKNPYLGLIIGLVIVVLLVNALFIKFKGPYTTIFAVIGVLGTVGDLMYHFFKYREENHG